MSKRKLFVIADTETVTDARILLDIAWIVCDIKGNELERFNAIPKELIQFPFGKKIISSDRFTCRRTQDGIRKSDWYINNINNGEINIMSLKDIRSLYHSIGERYNGTPIFCAYNADFDVQVLNSNSNIYGYGNFFKPNDKIFDIWHAALCTICDSETFALWAWTNKMLSESGNIRTNAETIYRYMKKDIDFEERHTALADCEIEKEILFKARKSHKKIVSTKVMPVWKCEEWLRLQARIQ